MPDSPRGPLELADDLDGDQLDQAYWPVHREAFTRVFAARTRDEWMRIFEDTDACVAPVLSLAEAPEHPHMVAREVFADVGGAPQPRVAPRFSRTPGLAPTPPRRPGQDTGRVLERWGFGPEEIEKLAAGHAVHCGDEARSS
jgi:alpha-methylacyl-CoA racemase